MDNGIGIVGERTGETEDGAAQMMAAPACAADSRGTNGQTKDSDEHEVFEDTLTDAESFYMPHHLDAKNAFVGKVESGVVSEGNNGDTGSADVDANDHSSGKEHDASVIVESVTSSQANDICSGQLETVAADEAAACPEEEPGNSHESISELNADDSHSGVAEDLNIDVVAAEDSYFSQKLADGLEKQEAVDSHAMTDAADESELAPRTEDGEGTREIKLSSHESNGVIFEAYSVPNNDGEIVPDSANKVLGSEKPESGVVVDEVSFSKAVDADDFKYEEDISNKHELQELQREIVDVVTGHDEIKAETDSLLEDISNKHELQELQREIVDVVTGHDEIKAETDSLLVDGVSTNSNDTHDNEDPLKQSEIDRTIPQSTSNVEEVTSKESVLVEDFGDLSSTDDDESNSFSQQELPSHSHPEPSAVPSLPSRPAGLGSSAPLLEPASRSLHSPRTNGSVPRQQTQISEDSVSDDTEESDEIREKLQMIRVKFLRLAHRLGQTPHNVVVAQVLYRLGLAEQLRRNINRPGVFSFDRASVMAEQLEAAGQEPLDFSCTILVIGKTGVGKSSTINSILDDAKLCTDAFHLATKKVQNVMGTVQGIKVRVIDTPGLSSCSTDHRRNEQILNSIKRFISKTSPDIVLYFDRLDMQSRDYGDVTLLRTITDVFGASIWFNAIVVLTHAASAPPDGPNGTPLSYEMFVTQRSHVVQQAIRQAAGDVRLMNPISLVENHSACRMNRAGQRVLPNGQVWKPQLLLLSFASKILQEANMLLKLVDSPPGKPFGSRPRVPPLPFLLSSLLQSRPQLKLPEEQMVDDDNLFEDLGETSDSDDGSDYDELPPFKCLTRSQLAKLSKAQRKAYYEELDYREKLFFKKQLKEEKKRRKLLKKMAESIHDVPHNHNGENLEDESGGPASVPVPMPDLVLPNSFDSDYPSHRYRFLDSSNRWLVRPVLETQGWDHDVGYEGLNVERLLVVKDKIPLSISGQLTKDKKDCTIQMEVASSIKHSEGRASSVGLDLQTVGKDMAYTLRGETKFKNFRCNNTTTGISVTILGESASAGVKIEDKLVLNKRLSMLISGGAMSGRGDIAYGGRLEATLRDKDYPIGRSLSTIALSIVDWHGDLAVGCNIQTQHSLGRGTNVICHGNLSNKGNGQVGIRLNTSEQLQIALLALLPIFKSALRMLSVSHQPM